MILVDISGAECELMRVPILESGEAVVVLLYITNRQGSSPVFTIAAVDFILL